MSVATFRLPNFPTQDPATYKSYIDAGFGVAKRLADAYAPHAQATPNMTVALDAGFIFSGNALTEVAAQNSAAIAASSLAGITRIDRIVIDQITGAVSVVSGTSVAPTLPAGKNPVAQVAVTTASTAVTNSMITDERAFPTNANKVDYQVFTSTAAGQTWTKPTAAIYTTNAFVVMQAWAGGGGGSTLSGGGGGGGGAFLEMIRPLSDFSTSETVTVGNGGAPGALGGLSNVRSNVFFQTFPGRGSTVANSGGGGGGQFGAGSGVDGGAPKGGTGGGAPSTSILGGGSGGGAGANDGGPSVYGGGGGGGGSGAALGGNGGASIFGAGGGAGASVGAARSGGVSVYGGNGGNGSTAAAGTGTAGSIPGGGGGNNAAGARGEVRIWVFP